MQLDGDSSFLSEGAEEWIQQIISIQANITWQI